MTPPRFHAVGIDPGATGSIAYYQPMKQVWRVWDMPTIVLDSKGKTKRQRVVGSALADIFEDIRDLVLIGDGLRIGVENVHAMPKDGAVGAFSFGTNFGIILGVLGALKLPYEYVQPPTWKKHFNIAKGSDKAVSRRKVIQQFPQHAHLVSLVKHHGRADAMLIAAYLYESS